MEPVLEQSKRKESPLTDLQLNPAREWKLRPDAQVLESEFPALIQSLQVETGLSPVTLRVCLMRGLTTAAAIHAFLSPRLESLMDPLFLKDMDRAIDRLVAARAAHEMIRVYADYDVDGTTAAALLFWFFRDSAFRFDVRQPDRFKDGYGLNVRAVEEASAAGVRLLLTVDCGITSHEAAARARELGIDLVIVDHHQLDARGVPPCVAAINPQRSDCHSGLKQLCGCGLAFYLVRALRTRGKLDGWWAAGAEPNLKQHLDLVVMATAADMVPLIGDNHVLAHHGLEVLKHSKKPGVRALLEAAGIGGVSGKEISPSHLGFVIGPRINASGRMVSAEVALDLLTTTEPGRATVLAQELERLNSERAAVQNRIWDEVKQRIDLGIAEGRFRHAIVVADASWHEGVVGIVASRVTETYRRPAAVIALREDFGKGSVRSYAGKDVLAALRVASETLLGFGGHRHAAGLSVALDRVDDFAAAFDLALSEIEEDAALRPLYLEGACSVSDLDVRTVQELERLGPFGPGNPEPVFSLRAAVKSHVILKGRHLKLNLMENKTASATSVGGAIPLEAIWFHAAEREDVQNRQLFAGESEWAGVPELNRFRGRITPTLRVKDCRYDIT